MFRLALPTAPNSLCVALIALSVACNKCPDAEEGTYPMDGEDVTAIIGEDGDANEMCEDLCHENGYSLVNECSAEVHGDGNVSVTCEGMPTC